MSCIETNTEAEAVRAISQETLLELLAPDRKPRLQSFCRAEANQEPRLPDQLKNELERLVSDPVTATSV